MALVITPIVRRLALRNGFIDKADGGLLKIHKESTALLGGVAIVIAYIVGLWLLLVHSPQSIVHSKMQIMGIVIGGLLIFGVGLWDDVEGVKPRVRLLVQVLAGVAVFWVGTRVNFIPISWIAIPLTLFYIVGAINAFNVIDGMDGLCAGISLVACVGFFYLGLKGGNALLTGLSAILFMGLLGFLPYNFHPARIFLGDAGSGFLGFMMGTMAVMATSKPLNFASFVAPILVICVPVLDMAFAILRRLVREKPLFIGDRDHMYDLLLNRNWSQSKVWCFMCGVQAVMAGIVILAVSG